MVVFVGPQAQDIDPLVALMLMLLYNRTMAAHHQQVGLRMEDRGSQMMEATYSIASFCFEHCEVPSILADGRRQVNF